MDNLCYLCLVFVMLSRMFIGALWLTSWFLSVMFYCVFCYYPGYGMVLDFSISPFLLLR